MSQTILDVFQGKENIEQFTIQPGSVTVLCKEVPDQALVRQLDGVEKVVVKDKEVQCFFTTDDFVSRFENEMKQKEPFSFKRLGQGILNALSGSLVPLIPMLIGAAMFKTVASIIGPDMLGWIDKDSGLYVLFNLVGDAGFYFFPIVIGYTAAKTFHTSPVLGMFLGAILIHPTLVDIAQHNGSLSVYGIETGIYNYSSTILPAILSVWAMSYVERFFTRTIPESIQVVFVPFLTIAVMLPLALIVFGPIGSVAGKYLSDGLRYLGDQGGIVTILTIMTLGGLWQFIVMGGLHWILISSIFMVLSQSGQESLVTAITGASSFAVGGMCLGALLKMRNKENKSLAISCLISQVIGGVTEPGLYGIGIKYKTPLIGMIAGGMVGGLYAAIVHLTAYNFMPVASFLCVLNYAGGTSMNFINGIIACAIGFAVPAVITFMTY
ncbi:MAG: PTS transporter subunit EIIC, partial [Erysipelotrichaceae bacterium]|nr:PTS transporter subunit EIIC [Erysipelotrichaceae bacterium]